MYFIVCLDMQCCNGLVWVVLFYADTPNQEGNVLCLLMRFLAVQLMFLPGELGAPTPFSAMQQI